MGLGVYQDDIIQVEHKLTFSGSVSQNEKHTKTVHQSVTANLELQK